MLTPESANIPIISQSFIRTTLLAECTTGLGPKAKFLLLNPWQDSNEYKNRSDENSPDLDIQRGLVVISLGCCRNSRQHQRQDNISAESVPLVE